MGGNMLQPSTRTLPCIPPQPTGGQPGWVILMEQGLS